MFVHRRPFVWVWMALAGLLLAGGLVAAPSPTVAAPRVSEAAVAAPASKRCLRLRAKFFVEPMRLSLFFRR